MGDNNSHDCCTHSMVGKDEIIPGMAELLQYIRDQDQKIKNLENNEKIREAKIQLLLTSDQTKTSSREFLRVKKENEELKERNQNLKSRLKEEESKLEEWENATECCDPDELVCRLEDLEDTETKYEKLKELSSTFAQQSALLTFLN
tara:strand:+ start:756 stop:1196 length:441 start_codon:yes stop_codon:yes gene_type:complete